jgi:hypothetical protein
MHAAAFVWQLSPPSSLSQQYGFAADAPASSEHAGAEPQVTSPGFDSGPVVEPSVVEPLSVLVDPSVPPPPSSTIVESPFAEASVGAIPLESSPELPHPPSVLANAQPTSTAFDANQTTRFMSAPS